MDATVTKGVADTFLAMGLPGAIIVCLGFFCYKLFGLYNEVQEKRINEARESVKAIEANTSALETLTTILRARSPNA